MLKRCYPLFKGKEVEAQRDQDHEVVSGKAEK